MNKLKKYFITGLISILPIFITLYILWIIFKFVGKFLSLPISVIFGELFNTEMPRILVTTSSFIITIILIWFIGVLITNIFGKKFLSSIETLLNRIPLVGGIYTTIKKIRDVFLMDKTGFKRVVLVEFPRNGVYSIGFITSEGMGEVQEKTKEFVINVFIPTTPNPTTGFFIMIPKENIIPLDMSVDDAIKLILTGGAITPPFKKEQNL